MKQLFKPAFFLALGALFTACADDSEPVDTTEPTIANIQHSEVVEPGGEFEISFNLEDNMALGEVRINIHDDFDGHEHERIKRFVEPWEHEDILLDAQGKKTFTIQEQIEVPADAATGPYHLQLRFFDAAGNEGEFYVSSFEIASEAKSPAITITNFGVDEELEPDENGILLLQGTIESSTESGLEEVHILVTEEHDEHANGRTIHDGDPLYEREWELEGAMSFKLEEEIDPAIDLSEAAPGHYELKIIAKDVEGNVKVYTREIHVD